MDKCSICNKEIDTETAPLLTIGGYGIPRYLCDECSADIETATTSRDAAECADAIGKIGEKMANGDPDGATYRNVCKILDSAKERASLIAAGEYDFALDEAEDDSFDEIPEDIQETEEDRALDEQDEEKARKIDKVFNWIYIGIGVAFAAYVIWKLVERFLLN